MNNTAAIRYVRESYNNNSEQPAGRKAAGGGFLKSLVKYGRGERLYCYAGTQQDFSDFCELIQPWVKRPRKVRWLPANDLRFIAQAGTIYIGDPGLNYFAWPRRFIDQRAFSICGITHTISTQQAMTTIGNLLLAPIQPWDALICTSVAVKKATETLLENWADYLEEIMGRKRPQKLIYQSFLWV